MEKKVPPEIFISRVEKVRKSLMSGTMDSLVFINGKGPDNEKTVAIVSWLLAGYNVTETIIALSSKAIVFYASQRKIDFLSNLSAHKVSFVVKDDSSTNGFMQMWKELHGFNSSPKVGIIDNETYKGDVAEKFVSFLSSQSHSNLDSLPLLQECLSVKDSADTDDLKKAASVTCFFFNKLVEDVLQVVDTGKPTKHSEIAGTCLSYFQNKAELKKCSIKQVVSSEYIDIGAGVSLQSGNPAIKIFAAPDDNELKSGFIVAGLGTLYRSFNAYIARTLLIEPNEEQKSFYKKVEALSKIVAQNLRVGVKISDAYKKSRQFMVDNMAGTEPPRNFGFGIGVLLTEQMLSINESNERVIVLGNAFLVNVCFPNLQTKAGTPYAIHLVDTVLVSSKGLQKLTDDVSKSLAEITYSFDNEEQQKKQPKAVEIIPSDKKRRVQENAAQKLKNQQIRNLHQIELKKKKQEELLAKVNLTFEVQEKKAKINVTMLECYRRKEELPQDLKKGLIYVDVRHSAVLLPIGSNHVPFHVALLKSVVKSEEGRYSSLRFNFHVPHSLTTLDYTDIKEPAVYFKEAVFRSLQTARIAELEKQVKNLQKKLKNQTTERQAKDDVVEQEKINLNKNRRPILRDVYSRPGVGPKKVKGILQCHFNGFKWATGKGETLQVLFSNIRFAFIQPCEQEIIAAVHFRLKSPIMVGKKKTEDIQFYAEGASVTDDVVGRMHNEDSDDEERQKEAKKKIDKQFRAWAHSCRQFFTNQFTFEQPRRKEGFFGTTYRANVLLQPTESCLINVTEPKAFVLCLKDIEVVCFERMFGNARYFDIAIVYKDYENFLRVSSIEVKDADKVKDWLDKNNIVFYDSKASIDWGKLLLTIRSDFPQFVKVDGGWTAWDSDSDDDQEEDPQSGDSEFSAEDDDDDDESNDTEEESEEDYEEEKDSDDEESDEDLSERGLSWSQMQERAELQDREKMRKDMEKYNEGQAKRKR